MEKENRLDKGDTVPVDSYRQAISNNILLTRALIAAGIVIAIQAAGYVALWPLKTKEYVAIEFLDGSQNFVRIQKAGGTLRNNTLLIKYMLRQYISDREKIDHMTEQNRYARVKAMSGSDVWSRFRAVYGGSNSLYAREGFSRQIEITRESNLADNIWQIEFKTIDHYEQPTERTITNEWVANLEIHFSEQETSEDIGLYNPLGMFVTKYSLSRRKV